MVSGAVQKSELVTRLLQVLKMNCRVLQIINQFLDRQVNVEWDGHPHLTLFRCAGRCCLWAKIIASWRLTQSIPHR